MKLKIKIIFSFVQISLLAVFNFWLIQPAMAASCSAEPHWVDSKNGKELDGDFTISGDGRSYYANAYIVGCTIDDVVWFKLNAIPVDATGKATGNEFQVQNVLGQSGSNPQVVKVNSSNPDTPAGIKVKSNAVTFNKGYKYRICASGDQGATYKCSAYASAALGGSGTPTDTDNKAGDTNLNSGKEQQASKGGLVPCGKNSSVTSNGSNLEYTGSKPSDTCTVEDIFRLIARVTNYLLFMAGFFAVFQIIRSAFSMVLANGSPEGIAGAKKALIYSVIGLVLCLMAYVVINSVINVIFPVADPAAQSIIENPLKFIQSK